MKVSSAEFFYQRWHNLKTSFPFDAQMELTYRCNLNCLHCYCKGLEDKGDELTTDELKRIIDEIHQQGCLWLALTGGEPLIRADFLDIYAYAKRKGFIITIFTNGQLFNQEIVDYLVKAPPYSIEITLNGIAKDTYEKISQIESSFTKVIANIKRLVKNKLPVIIKTNLLQENKAEIAQIKKWVESILGKPLHKHYFKYDPFIYPRLNGDMAPCKHRLSFQEISDILRNDQDMWQQFQAELCRDFPHSNRDNYYLYHCNSWMTQFFINPFAKLKFCLFSEKFSVDLRQSSFKEGFYKIIPRILKERFRTSSQCRNCNLRPICFWCPARANLEMGNEEKPVEYYCQLARTMAEETKRLQVARSSS